MGINREIKKIKLYIFLAFFLISFLLVLFSGVISFDEETLGGILSQGFYVSIILYTLLIAITVSTSLPSSVVAFAGIALFSLYILIPMTVVGLFIGLSFMYYFTEKFGEEGLESYAKLKGKRLQAFLRLININTTSFVVLFTFFYFFPSNLASVAGSLGDMKFKKFISIALIGNTINFSGFIFLSYGIYSANWYFIVPSVSVLIAMSLTPLFIYRRSIEDILSFIFNREIKLKGTFINKNKGAML
jgi:uncharacterized membrane protein YdjX (TVP38/TMEM64 family)